MPNRVHPAVQEMQTSGIHQPPNSTIAEPKLDQLRMASHPVLCPGERRQSRPISPRLHFVPHSGIKGNLAGGSPPAALGGLVGLGGFFGGLDGEVGEDAAEPLGEVPSLFAE